MKNILEELYNGKIYPAELIISKDTQYRTLNQKFSDKMESWKNKLTEDDYMQLEALLDLRNETSEMESMASYMYGFKLGALIMVEVLTGMGELARNDEETL